MNEWTFITTTTSTIPEPGRVRFERWRGLGHLIAVCLRGDRIHGYYLPAPGESLPWRDLPLLPFIPTVEQPFEEWRRSSQILHWIEHNRASFTADPPDEETS